MMFLKKLLPEIFVIVLLFCIIGCCPEKSRQIQEAVLVEYSVPFYERTHYSSPDFYYGIKTGRFFYVENLRGPWLLYDKHIDPEVPVNMVGFDEYTFIQLDLSKQLHELIQKNTNNYFPGEMDNQKWFSPVKEKTNF